MNKLLILLSITLFVGTHSETRKIEIHSQISDKHITDIGKLNCNVQSPYNLNSGKMNQILNKARRYEDYMVHGIIAKDGQFPYQVSLRDPFSKKHFCGGAIISIKHVVTAAHCFCDSDKFRDPDDIMVSAGLINLAKNDGVNYEVERTACHNKYHEDKLFHDIGLITIRGTFKFNNKVKHINLITGANRNVDKPIEANLNVVVSGWGTEKDEGYASIASDKLMYISTRTLDINYCDTMYKPYYQDVDARVKNWNVCTQTGHQRTCLGDSGSPVVYRGQLLGVVSWAVGCTGKVPNVHTSIPHHYNWIYSEIRKDMPLTPSTNRYRSRKPRQ